MNKRVAIAAGAVVLLLLLLIFSTTYTVAFHQVAIRTTFGRASAESVKTEPGLKWKWPIVQDTKVHDTRLQVRESPAKEISTADGHQVVVKAFLLWQVDAGSPEALIEFDRKHGSVDQARDDLLDPFVTELAGTLSEYRLQDLLGPENRLAEAEQRIAGGLEPLRATGIRPVQVGITQLTLPERTTGAVIARMQATRTRLAEAKRAEGNAQAEGVVAGARTAADVIQQFANLRAQEIRLEAEAKASQYLEQMSQEEDLAKLLLWLDTIDSALSRNPTFILDPNFAPWHLLNLSSTLNANGVPMPPNGLEPEERIVETPPPAGGASAAPAETEETESERLAREQR